MPIATIKDDLAVYEQMRNDLELDHTGEWVLIYDRELIKFFAEFQAAASYAVQKYGRGPYLIKRVGENRLSMPMSMLIR